MEDIDIIYEKYKEPDEDRFTEEFNWENYLLEEEGGKCIDYSRGSGKGSALGMGNEDGTGDGGTDEYEWYVYESYGWDIVSVNGQKTYDIDESPVVLYSSFGFLLKPLKPPFIPTMANNSSVVNITLPLLSYCVIL